MPESLATDLMQAEMDAALASAIFQRSPVLSRLLRFLVMATLSGEGPALKSYAVAVEGLGKPADFDPQADSYARVQVIRLRRALEGFYAGEGACRPWHLVIETGGYEVKLQPAGAASAPGAPPARPAEPGPAEPRPDKPAAHLLRRIGNSTPARWAAVLALLLAVLAGVHVHTAREEAARRWGKSDFPFLAIRVSIASASAGAFLGRDPEELRQSLLARAARYEGTRVLREGEARADYVVDITLRAAAGSAHADILVIDTAEQRIVWSGTEPFAPGKGWNEEDPGAPLGHELFRLLGPSGIIHGYARRWRTETASPYGCWLRFGQLLQENPFADDPEVAECADDWFSHQPNNPLAAALKGWVLTGEANRAFSEAARRRGLLRAIHLLERTDAVSPGMPMIHVAAMRAHALAGNRAMVIEEAGTVLQWNPDSLQLRGAAGTYLVFQNVAGGEELVDSAIAGHDNPPAWYFVAKFAAALSRDDPEAARRALARLRASGAEGMGLHLMATALAARQGDMKAAMLHRRAMEAEQPLTLLGPEVIVRRLPLSPDLADRFRQWLAPAFPDLRDPAR